MNKTSNFVCFFFCRSNYQSKFGDAWKFQNCDKNQKYKMVTLWTAGRPIFGIHFGEWTMNDWNYSTFGTYEMKTHAYIHIYIYIFICSLHAHMENGEALDSCFRCGVSKSLVFNSNFYVWLFHRILPTHTILFVVQSKIQIFFSFVLIRSAIEFYEAIHQKCQLFIRWHVLLSFFSALNVLIFGICVFSHQKGRKRKIETEI